MKTINVGYTFRVARTVKVPPNPDPTFLTDEEWERQCIDDLGQQIEMGIDGSVEWEYSLRD